LLYLYKSIDKNSIFFKASIKRRFCRRWKVVGGPCAWDCQRSRYQRIFSM